MPMSKLGEVSRRTPAAEEEVFSQCRAQETFEHREPPSGPKKKKKKKIHKGQKTEAGQIKRTKNCALPYRSQSPYTCFHLVLSNPGVSTSSLPLPSEQTETAKD